MLATLAKVGGVTCLTIGVFYLLYKQILAMGIFANLSRNQTFATIALLAFLTWIVAMTALVGGTGGVTSLVFGHNNTVTQN